MDNPFTNNDEDQVRDTNPGTGNKIKGTAEELAGKAQQGLGDLTNNREMQAKGEAKEMKGKMEKGAGEAENRLNEAANDLTS